MLPRWLKRAVDVEDKGKLVSDQFLQIERAEQKRMQEALTCRVSYGSPGSKAPKKSFCLAGLEKGSKNRYNNIYPFDYSRVRLQGVPSGGCDYVNASFIESSRSNKRYIATQAPIPATFNDFWRVVWEQDIRVIVMLTAESEGPQLKCHPYWKAADYGPLKVSVFAEHQIPLYSFSSPRSQQQRRTHGQRRATSPFTQFEKPHATEGSQYFGVVANDNRPHAIVRHLTLTHTPTPSSPSARSRNCNTSTGRLALADRKQPAAGGPSGDGGDDAGEQEVWLLREDVDLIAATVEEFRTQRISMVQSLRQLVLCYESVLEWITQHAGELGMGDEAADEVEMKKGV
ncbi:protein tyrosine phosphatase [Histoplasma capsulatum var. duboisii H88]|uniref:Protein tyrosine phosphatase n=1 Tax=Ajellomyces capsulatus (strain H88) TaxID=544711 RepID=F0UI66_AJEC8|nr:protein tyrosine phosphatase [Histoplasma capsulatum var. duboisii H88]